MKTPDLINVLVADRAATSPGPFYAVALAVGIGAVMAALLLLLSIGVRPDLAGVALSPRFLAKSAIALLLAASAIGLTIRLSYPDGHSGLWKWALCLVPLLVAVTAIAELIAVPSAQWESRLFGIHWLACLALIPLFSLPPLAGLLFALKHAAPSHGGLAGAIAGLAAGGIAASIYVLHCPDDSPLFVAAWYTLAIGFVSLLGYLGGGRWLKW